MPLINKPKVANYKFGGQADKPVRTHEYKPDVFKFSYKGVIIERKGSSYRITPPKLKGFDMALIWLCVMVSIPILVRYKGRLIWPF